MRVVDRSDLKGTGRLYVGAILVGLWTTLRHALVSLFSPETMPVVFYPEQDKELPPTTRGLHRLMHREDGSPRCTACMCCSTVCPAECIHIKAEESPDPVIEKRPELFDIDLLRCVFCGFCVEACPLDAIRMDRPQIAIAEMTRQDFVLNKEKLMDHDNRDVVDGYNPPRPVAWTHGPVARP